MNQRFLLNREQGKVMGVAAGLADWTGIDALVIRLGLVIAARVRRVRASVWCAWSSSVFSRDGNCPGRAASAISTPAMIPTLARRTAWPTMSRTTSPARAPRAIRTAISRVRCATS